MRVAGLSAATGVSVATLKYYVREGLLHAGTATAVNQADYDESHIRRVRLIRALLDVGRMSIADARDVVRAVDDSGLSIHDAFGVAQDAMAAHWTGMLDRDDPDVAAAFADVDRFVRRHGLRIRPDAEVRAMLAGAVLWLHRFSRMFPEGMAGAVLFDGLVPDLLAQAEFEVGNVPDDVPRGDQMEYAVVGTVLFELGAAAVRRMALEHASAERFGRRRRRRS